MICNFSLFFRALTLSIFSIMLVACEQSTSSSTPLNIDQVVKDDAGWPRSIMTSKGLITLAEMPKRIVSTSVTLSGTLLAINAPLVASGATMSNTDVASEQGFMRQWSDIAKERGLVPLYNTEPNAEAIIQANPDLIIISLTGGDSAMKLYDQLKDIAPTLVIGYDNKSWMQLATIFGDILGLEQQAQSAIDKFETQLERTKQSLVLPPQPTTAMVYYRDATGGNIWTDKSAQGRLLEELGFTLAKVPDSVKGDISMGIRDDITIATGEHFPDAITGNTVLLFSAADDRVQDLKSNAFLASAPAIVNNQVYAVGNDTFRLDYYSASNLLIRLESLFGSKNDQ